MSQVSPYVSFIRKRIKYSTAKQYVADLTPLAINQFWFRFGEIEHNGEGRNLFCGRINDAILQAAFLREMSYNPLRFGAGTLTVRTEASNETSEIIKNILDILKRFSLLWPNGIMGNIIIYDISDAKYQFMRDLRDCFKSICMRNMADLKIAEYRDEIVAHFASAPDIPMAENVRAGLRELAAKSATRRGYRRDIRILQDRISATNIEITLHRSHDREFCEDIRRELDNAYAQLDVLQLKLRKEERGGGRTAPRKGGTPNANIARNTDAMPKALVRQTSAYIPAPSDEQSEDITDASEREMELLRTMTPEHSTDELFQEYMEKCIGFRVKKSGKDFQH
ncbi:MAG: hypothetical protein K2I81_03610 [Alphaproteobacteria bacterium]|nr:hypothetical protein [Alphaproteobacteria bacterium]